MIVNNQLTANVSVTASANPACAGTSVTFTAIPFSEGASPTYQWKLGGADITGAIGATYSYVPSSGDAISVVMTSSLACATGSPATSTAVTMSVSANPTAPTAGSITQPTCANPTGSVVLSGLPAGNWTINPGAITGSTVSKTISNLSAGTYNYTVTNSSGCISPAVTVVMNAPTGGPTAPIVTLTQPTCSSSTGTITVKSPIATGMTYSIGGAYKSGTTFNAVSPGIYFVTAKNSSGCISAGTSATINAPPLGPAAPTVTVIQPTCTVSTGTITMTAPIGTGLTYSIGGNYQSGKTFSGLASGNYTVTAKNSSGCISPGKSVTINANPQAKQPGNFTTSSSTVNQKQTNVKYTVPLVSGVTYNWSYSGTGATITGTSNSVLVSFSATATSGTLSVRASNSCGTSSPRSIYITANRVKSAMIVDSLQLVTNDAPVAQNELKVYPNPFTEKLNFVFTSVADTHAKLEIYSITGAKLESIFDSNILGGQIYTVEYLPKLVSSQMVFYYLIMGDKTYIGKVLYNERK
jgi:hypothetical protein